MTSSRSAFWKISKRTLDRLIWKRRMSARGEHKASLRGYENEHHRSHRGERKPQPLLHCDWQHWPRVRTPAIRYSYIGKEVCPAYSEIRQGERCFPSFRACYRDSPQGRYEPLHDPQQNPGIGDKSLKLSQIFQEGLDYAIFHGTPWYMCVRLRELDLPINLDDVTRDIRSIMNEAGMTRQFIGDSWDGGVDDHFWETGMADAYVMTWQETIDYGSPAYAMWVQFWFFVIFDLARKGQ
ncbi:hypothetical protein PJG4_164 [Pseudomonas phage JG004]|uniref:Uncharacterized protein n=1 Tax=Pseudomonas phage JG004 TaxID=757342 RepID=F4YDT0_9CAUD|nr:hypothetical protein PJG4_164 [Pseudomonas phage JG004]AEC53254.1 hypothetical protein PJG4_164 [Pseudomonas phage JG004]